MASKKVADISTREALDKVVADFDELLAGKAKATPAELDLYLKQVRGNLEAMANHTHNLHCGKPKPAGKAAPKPAAKPAAKAAAKPAAKTTSKATTKTTAKATPKAKTATKPKS